MNDISGSGSVHTAHGLMLQDFSVDQGQKTQTLPAIHKGKKRLLSMTENEELEDCYIVQRKSPKINVVRDTLPGSENANILSQRKDIAWLVIRMLDKDKCNVPGWAGFVSLTGEKPERLTVLDYYPVIHKPLTQNSTVQECLRVAQKATEELGQLYVYTTFDLGVCMKAYPIIWNHPEKFSKHIIMIGTFHLAMGFYKMIGKKMEGSGFGDILLEANMVSSGSLQGVINGKNYSRETHCHKTLVESLHRLLMHEFMITCQKSEIVQSIVNLESYESIIKYPSTENLEKFLTENSVHVLVKDYLKFGDSV